MDSYEKTDSLGKFFLQSGKPGSQDLRNALMSRRWDDGVVSDWSVARMRSAFLAREHLQTDCAHHAPGLPSGTEFIRSAVISASSPELATVPKLAVF